MRVLCTAGHVDHGKSTLVTALTGTDPDRLAEEQRRGLTIDLGFAWTTLPPIGDIAFVDLPGHERFVPTMLAGAGPVGTALFVVAADEGWMPQSAEHLAILDLLEIRGGIVALTRADLVDGETLEIAAALLRDQLAGSVLEDAPIIPVSAVTGTGLEDLRGALVSLLEQTPAPADLGRPRVWVDRAFTVRGAGTVVTGTLADGTVAVGDTLTVWPGDVETRVRGLQALQHPVDRAEPGWRVALNLVGVDIDQVDRGSMLGRPGQWRSTDVLDVWCTPTDGATLGRRGAWRLHLGTAEVGGTLFPTGGTDLHHPGPVRVALDRPLPLAVGDRFVLREVGRGLTAGGGMVLDPAPGPRPRGRTQRGQAVAGLTTLAQEVTGTPADRLRAVVRHHGAMVEADALPRAGVPESAVAGSGVLRVGAHLLDPTRWDALADVADRTVRSVHADRPALAVVDRAVVRAALAAAGADEALATAMISELVARGQLDDAPGGVRAPGHRPVLTDAQQAARAALLARLDEEGWEAAPVAELAAACEADADLISALVRDGEVIGVEGGARLLSRTTVDRAMDRLRSIGGPFTAAQARDALGTTRRFALPLLEALDDLGLTRRDGDQRTLR